MAQTFKVILAGSGLRVEAEIPAEFSFSVQQEYADPFRATVGEKLQAIAQSVSGGKFSFNLDFKGVFVWMGSSPIEVSMDLVFPVKTKVSDVTDNIRALVKMCSPRDGMAGMLAPPTVAMGLSIDIGNILRFDDIVLTAVTPTFSKPYVTGGVPIKVPVSITFQTRQVLKQDVIDSILFF